MREMGLAGGGTLAETELIARRLGQTLPELRAVIKGRHKETLRAKRGAALSAMERIVGLFMLETEMIRPALTLMLEQDHPALPGFDLPARAAREGYNAFESGGMMAHWAGVRVATIGQVRSLTPRALRRTGLTPAGEAVDVAGLLALWLRTERDELRAIAAMLDAA